MLALPSSSLFSNCPETPLFPAFSYYLGKNLLDLQRQTLVPLALKALAGSSAEPLRTAEKEIYYYPSWKAWIWIPASCLRVLRIRSLLRCFLYYFQLRRRLRLGILRLRECLHLQRFLRLR